MKKKQLFAVLLAGSMTVGMAPAAAFAAEDTAVTEAQQTADDNTEAAEGADAGEQAAEETPSEDTQAQSDAGEQTASEEQAQAEEQAAVEEAAQTQEEVQQEQTAAEGNVVTDEAGLVAAINSAANLEDPNNAAEADLTKIVVSGTISITNTITVPAGKGIVILGADENAQINRADGFAGDLFAVNGALYMAKKDATETESAGTLSVDGSVGDSTQVAGSLIHVAAGAKFSMTTGIKLINNTTSASGAAVFNEGGIVQITGGTITGNKSDKGAIYSTGSIFVKKGDGAADTEPAVTGNTMTDGQTPANIVLAGTDGKIVVSGALTSPQIGFSVENVAENYVAVAKADDVSDSDFASALTILASQYEGDKNYKVDSEGKLVSNRPTVQITATEWKSGAATATATISSDKAGTYCYAYVKKGAAAPSIENSTEGGHVDANGTATIKLDNLTDSAIDLYVWVKTDDGAVNAEPAKTTITKAADPVVKPVIKAVTSKWASRTHVTVTLNSTKAGTCYYKWVKRNASAKNDKKNKVSVSKAGNFKVTLENLDANSAIDLWVWFVDNDGQEVSKQIKLNESRRPKAETQTKASLRWTGFSWRDHSSATVNLIIGADGTCNYTWKEKDSNKDGGSGKVSMKKDKSFAIELNNLPDKEIELYITAKDSKGNDILLQTTINGVVKTAKSFKITLSESSRPAIPTPSPTNVPDAYVPDVKESVVQGLDDALQFYPNTFYEFTVIGAGTTNENPNEGDVKWVPIYWSTVANPTSKQQHTAWKIGSTSGINKEATYNLYIFFQKYIYTGGQWNAMDTVESAVYQFKSATLTPSGTPGADGTDGSGGQTGSDPDATVTGEASATSANGDGTSSRNAVSTADNSPIGTMAALVGASLLAGGYVLVRRRKKEN